jgi:hypothetical protein
MLIAKPKQSALGLLNLAPRVLITKMLVSAAIVLGSGVVAAAPASADPNPSDIYPNPFGGLTCSCQETAPAGGPVRRDEIDRGIREGLQRVG